MSTSWSVVCANCKLNHYLGQRFTTSNCFGYGSNDEEGRKNAADFIDEHLGCTGELIIVSEHNSKWLDSTEEVHHEVPTEDK